MCLFRLFSCSDVEERERIMFLVSRKKKTSDDGEEADESDEDSDDEMSIGRKFRLSF